MKSKALFHCLVLICLWFQGFGSVTDASWSNLIVVTIALFVPCKSRVVLHPSAVTTRFWEWAAPSSFYTEGFPRVCSSCSQQCSRAEIIFVSLYQHKVLEDLVGLQTLRTVPSSNYIYLKKLKRQHQFENLLYRNLTKIKVLLLICSW